MIISYSCTRLCIVLNPLAPFIAHNNARTNTKRLQNRKETNPPKQLTMSESQNEDKQGGRTATNPAVQHNEEFDFDQTLEWEQPSHENGNPRMITKENKMMVSATSNDEQFKMEIQYPGPPHFRAPGDEWKKRAGDKDRQVSPLLIPEIPRTKPAAPYSTKELQLADRYGNEKLVDRLIHITRLWRCQKSYSTNRCIVCRDKIGDVDIFHHHAGICPIPRNLRFQFLKITNGDNFCVRCGGDNNHWCHKTYGCKAIKIVCRSCERMKRTNEANKHNIQYGVCEIIRMTESTGEIPKWKPTEAEKLHTRRILEHLNDHWCELRDRQNRDTTLRQLNNKFSQVRKQNKTEKRKKT